MSVDNSQDHKTGIIVAAGILAVIVTCLFLFSFEKADPVAKDTPMLMELNGTDTLDTKGQPDKKGKDAGVLPERIIRKRISEADTKNIHATVPCVVTLKITLDAAGNVTASEVVKGKTTATDQRIVNQVEAAVRKQVRYESKEGAFQEKAILSINIQ